MRMILLKAVPFNSFLHSLFVLHHFNRLFAVILNFLRGDIARLGRCVSVVTGEDGPLSRCKPFKYTYEKEIVLYAYYKKLVYFSTECIYAPNAYRGHAREYLKNLEACKPQTIISALDVGHLNFTSFSCMR
jgi:tRNA(Ile)-lysidine synthase TilS/MesJ